VQFKLFLTLAVLGASLCPAGTPSRRTGSDVYSRAIQELGGSVADPQRYPQTLAGFQAYLSASGVKALTASELTRPNHPQIAARLGFTHFLPPRNWWPRGASLALLVQKIGTQAQGQIQVRNWWRPAAYNSNPVVGGAKNGDHPSANAFDIDYSSVNDRLRAESFLRALDRRCPWLGLSMGLGAQTTHVGIVSPRGHREWHYAGWTRSRNG
jgi:hypothetical protein